MSNFNAMVLSADPTTPPIPVRITKYQEIQAIVGGMFDVKTEVLEGTHYGDMEISVYMCDEPQVWNQKINARITMFMPRFGLIRGTVLVAGGVDADGEQLSVHPKLIEAFIFAHREIMSGNTDPESEHSLRRARAEHN